MNIAWRRQTEVFRNKKSREEGKPAPVSRVCAPPPHGQEQMGQEALQKPMRVPQRPPEEWEGRPRQPGRLSKRLTQGDLDYTNPEHRLCKTDKTQLLKVAHKELTVITKLRRKKKGEKRKKRRSSRSSSSSSSRKVVVTEMRMVS